jgi:hypothetical protein
VLEAEHPASEAAIKIDKDGSASAGSLEIRERFRRRNPEGSGSDAKLRYIPGLNPNRPATNVEPSEVYNQDCTFVRLF